MKKNKSRKNGNKIKKYKYIIKKMSIWLILRFINMIDNKNMDNEYLKKFA